MRPITVVAGPFQPGNAANIAGLQQPPTAGALLLNGPGQNGGARSQSFLGSVQVTNRGVLTVTNLSWDPARLGPPLGSSALPDWIADFQNGNYWTAAGGVSNNPASLIAANALWNGGQWTPTITAGLGLAEVAAGAGNSGFIAWPAGIARNGGITILANLVSNGAPPINDPTFTRNTNWNFRVGAFAAAGQAFVQGTVTPTPVGGPPAVLNTNATQYQTQSADPPTVVTGTPGQQPMQIARARAVMTLNQNTANPLAVEGVLTSSPVNNNSGLVFTGIGFNSTFPAGIGATGVTYLALLAGFAPLPNNSPAAAPLSLASPVVPNYQAVTGALAVGMPVSGPNIPPGAFVAANLGGGQWQLSQRPIGASTLPNVNQTFGSMMVQGAATYTMDAARPIVISNTEVAPTQFVVTGTNASGQLITETLNANGGNLTTQQSFLTVTSVTISAPAQGSVSVGTGSGGYSPWVHLDPWADPSISYQLIFTQQPGGVQAYAQVSNDDPPPAQMTWLNDPNGAPAIGAVNIFNYWSFCPRWARIFVSGSGAQVRGTFVQTGSVNR